MKVVLFFIMLCVLTSTSSFAGNNLIILERIVYGGFVMEGHEGNESRIRVYQNGNVETYQKRRYMMEARPGPSEEINIKITHTYLPQEISKIKERIDLIKHEELQIVRRGYGADGSTADDYLTNSEGKRFKFYSSGGDFSISYITDEDSIEHVKFLHDFISRLPRD